MNVENINKTIAYLRTRDWHTDSYICHSQCMVGIVGDALFGNRLEYDAGDNHNLFAKETLLQKWLGISSSSAISLHSMSDEADDADVSWSAFEDLDTAQQNEAYIDVLERLRDTGKVFWAKVPH